VPGVSGVVRRGIFRGTASKKRMKRAKTKRTPCMSQRVMNPIL